MNSPFSPDIIFKSLSFLRLLVNVFGEIPKCSQSSFLAEVVRDTLPVLYSARQHIHSKTDLAVSVLKLNNGEMKSI